jgi:hypothetical protein
MKKQNKHDEAIKNYKKAIESELHKSVPDGVNLHYFNKALQALEYDK